MTSTETIRVNGKRYGRYEVTVEQRWDGRRLTTWTAAVWNSRGEIYRIPDCETREAAEAAISGFIAEHKTGKGA